VLRVLELDAPLVVGHSYGSSTAMLLGAHHPGLTGGLLMHEPPLFTLLHDDASTRHLAEDASEHLRRAASLIAAGAVAEGVRHFVDHAAFGPGAWDTLFTSEIRRTCLANAGTWLDQSRDPTRLTVRPELLADYAHPLVVSRGSTSLPAYGLIVELVVAALPRSRQRVVRGAGHAPHISHPVDFAELVLVCAQEMADERSHRAPLDGSDEELAAQDADGPALPFRD
ncbi:MAG: alpha/beta fold hydrolase, partial [Pseudonocardiaceae bacterium]